MSWGLTFAPYRPSAVGVWQRTLLDGCRSAERAALDFCAHFSCCVGHQPPAYGRYSSTSRVAPTERPLARQRRGTSLAVHPHPRRSLARWLVGLGEPRARAHGRVVPVNFAQLTVVALRLAWRVPGRYRSCAGLALRRNGGASDGHPEQIRAARLDARVCLLQFILMGFLQVTGLQHPP